MCCVVFVREENLHSWINTAVAKNVKIVAFNCVVWGEDCSIHISSKGIAACRADIIQFFLQILLHCLFGRLFVAFVA